ncbi:type II toxin-antitoxin system RelE/ParE family toxin [Phragmitibacter flavus]|uniref:Type II toxin-antitoxin system RelE/ParE family toxin n=1 Tax=Phragmitibacter flavus TaxID=2576071 RepID=A0A5R8KK33_9BACT|nr:type II toxin-antitoxin system RelE/ParE family toxin [Phragmitibacter flavus]TLD72610.1 type II toxin-antitoxin system RelE/ParE family toxin [Phragmitibacter flavus]
MPSRPIVGISPEAEQDIREACRWIARDNPKAALQLLHSISLVIEKIPDFPGRHSLSPETKLGFTDETVYQVLHGKSRTKYRVLFTSEKNRITIIRVLHGARKFFGQEFPEDDSDET